MNCSCDYEPSDVWTMDKVRARKPWACCECRGGITIDITPYQPEEESP
jgi:hypothetical protein